MHYGIQLCVWFNVEFIYIAVLYTSIEINYNHIYQVKDYCLTHYLHLSCWRSLAPLHKSSFWMGHSRSFRGRLQQAPSIQIHIIQFNENSQCKNDENISSHFKSSSCRLYICTSILKSVLVNIRTQVPMESDLLKRTKDKRQVLV